MSFLTRLSEAPAVAIVVSAVFCVCRASAGDIVSHPETKSDESHSVLMPASLTWKPVNAGMSIAVLSGSPDTPGRPFVIRLKLADERSVPPHWHPGDEHITVVSGNFHMGMGELFDKSNTMAMPQGAYAAIAKEVRHFGWAEGQTVLQIHGVGPFKTFFVGKPAN